MADDLEDTGERKVKAALLRLIGREPPRVERDTGYAGPGTRQSERRDNGLSGWAKLAAGWLIPLLLLAVWVGDLRRQVDDLRSERAGHEVRAEQVQQLRIEVEVLRNRVDWLMRRDLRGE